MGGSRGGFFRAPPPKKTAHLYRSCPRGKNHAVLRRRRKDRKLCFPRRKSRPFRHREERGGKRGCGWSERPLAERRGKAEVWDWGAVGGDGIPPPPPKNFIPPILISEQR